MLIDWFTVGAQALNFLILVWLMRRYLYRPILKAIDAREKRIAEELAGADARMAEAQSEREAFRHQNEELDQQREALLGQARDEAKAERTRLLDEARAAADASSVKRLSKARADARTLSQDLGRLTQQEVFAITRKTLADLATTSLEERLAEVFNRRVRELDAPAKAALVEALGSTPDPAIVRSAFDLPAEQRAAIQKALSETCSTEVHVSFETAPDLISGIELTANGLKVAWSIADYLASLQQGIVERLKAPAKPDPAREQTPANPTAPEPVPPGP